MASFRKSTMIASSVVLAAPTSMLVAVEATVLNARKVGSASSSTATSTSVQKFMTLTEETGCWQVDPSQKVGNVIPCLSKPTWVFCSDAVCDPPHQNSEGVWMATCHCMVNDSEPGVSLAATWEGGAPCVENLYSSSTSSTTGTGNSSKTTVTTSMCEAMAAGEYYSTFGAGTQPLSWPTTKRSNSTNIAWCEAGTAFAYCWGAKCDGSTIDANNMIDCACPMVAYTPPSDPHAKQVVFLEDYQCEQENKFSGVCDWERYPHNSIANQLSRLPTAGANTANTASASVSEDYYDFLHQVSYIVYQEETSTTPAFKVNVFDIAKNGQLEDVTSGSDLPICNL